MPRSRTRARNRRARLEKARAEFEENRQDPGALEGWLRRRAESDLCVWSIARLAARDKPLDEFEQAMIAQVVAPRLAGMTPGSVHRRHEETFRRTGPATRTATQVARGTSQVSSLTPRN
jgi:hypothetical protein